MYSQFTTTFRLTKKQATRLIKDCYTVHYSPLNRDEEGSQQYKDEDRRMEISEYLYFLLTLPIGTEVSMETVVKGVDQPSYTLIQFWHPTSDSRFDIYIYSNESDTALEIAMIFLHNKNFKEFKTYTSMVLCHTI
jgi:hypothetical protein